MASQSHQLSGRSSVAVAVSFSRRAANRRANQGCATTNTSDSTINTGTTALNAPGGNTSNNTAPMTAPSTEATPNRRSRGPCPASSCRYPRAPNSEPGTSPRPLDTLAVSGGYPTASSTGNVTRVPDPTTELIMPATTPAPATATACNGCTALPSGHQGGTK